MSYNKDILSFDDARLVLDKALETSNGLILNFSSHGKAVAIRARFNHFRKMDRLEKKQIYPMDHVMHGRTPYDALVLSIPKNSTQLIIRRPSIEDYEIIEIPENGDIEELLKQMTALPPTEK